MIEYPINSSLVPLFVWLLVIETCIFWGLLVGRKEVDISKSMSRGLSVFLIRRVRSTKEMLVVA